MLNIAARLSIFFGDKGFFIKHLLGEFGGCLATICWDQTWGPVAIETLRITGKICVGLNGNKIRSTLVYKKYLDSFARNTCALVIFNGIWIFIWFICISLEAIFSCGHPFPITYIRHIRHQTRGQVLTCASTAIYEGLSIRNVSVGILMGMGTILRTKQEHSMQGSNPKPGKYSINTLPLIIQEIFSAGHFLRGMPLAGSKWAAKRGLVQEGEPGLFEVQ